MKLNQRMDAIFKRTLAEEGEPDDELEFMFRLLSKHGVRNCDGCSMCCTVMDVREPPDIDKPMHEVCKHLDSCGKCAIYEKRPLLCKSYFCSYRLDELMDLGIPEALKPSRCGFVLSWDMFQHPKVMTLFKDQARPNAWTKHKKLLEKISRKLDVAIVIGGGTEATHYVTPMGRWVARADYPWLFDPDKTAVPSSEFRRPHP